MRIPLVKNYKITWFLHNVLTMGKWHGKCGQVNLDHLVDMYSNYMLPTR